MQFWFDFASPFSYIASVAIEREARGRGLEVEWHPFLLGPIFEARGRVSDVPARVEFMRRDCQRLTEARGIPYCNPQRWPRPAVPAARVVAALPRELIPAFSHAMFRASFVEDLDLRDPAEVQRVIDGMDGFPLSAKDCVELIAAEPGKSQLRRSTALAMEKSIFGAPTFITGKGELFWGQNQLVEALEWELQERQAKTSAIGAGAGPP